MSDQPPLNPWDNNAPGPAGNPGSPGGPGSPQSPQAGQQQWQQPPNPGVQGGYPQPGQHPAPSVAPKKGAPVGKILLGCGGFLLLALLGVGACTVFVLGTTAAPIDASNEFFAHLDNKEFDEALALTVEGDFTESSCTARLFVTGLQGGDVDLGEVIEDRDLSSVEVGKRISDDRKAADVSGTVRVVDSGEERDVEIRLLDEDGWKVCNLDLGVLDLGE